MEGREPLQDLADHLLASSSHPALPEPQELCWATDYPQLPSQYGGDADAAGGSSLGGGGAPGNGNDEEISTGKEKKRKVGCSGYRMRNAAKPRFAFRTRSSEDVLDDGYRWRKYGQKAVKDSIYPRSYYRCAHPTCNVKKQVQRMSEDTSTVVTTYEGVHNHPSEQLMEALAPLLRQIQFLASC